MRPIWISMVLVSALTNPCGAENPSPPFSKVYRRPVISPYMYADPNFNLSYWSKVQPLVEQQEDEIDGMRQWDRISGIERGCRSGRKPATRPTGQSSEPRDGRSGIRPTGHPTYFMYMH